MVASAICAYGPTAMAQTFKSDAPKIADREGRTLEQEIEPALQNAAEFQNADSRSKVESYYKDYLFPSMTQTSADALTKLKSSRDKLLRSLQGSQRPLHDAAFQALTKLTFDEMRRIATDYYHPHVRYNAMLIIGALDQAPTPQGAGAQAPAPLPETADFLLQMLQADASQAPDFVKLAAMIGLERHVAAGLPDDKKKVLADELVKLITSERPNYRTMDVHAWLQFRAVEMVTQFGELGEGHSVHNAIVAFMANDNVPLSDRKYAAKSLERLKAKYTPEAGIDAQATVAALGNVLADVMEAEKIEAFKFNQQRIGFGGMPLQDPFGDGKPIGYATGRFLQRINFVLDGFAAVEGALPADLKQEVQAVLALVNEIRAVALDRRATEVDLPVKIDLMADQVVDAAEGLGAAPNAAPADGEGLDQFGALNP
jgi:hypothetical protein